MCQPWARERNPDPRSLRLEMRYRFGVDRLPPEAIRLAVEQPARYVITVNGRTLSPDMQDGWWVDRSLRTLLIDPACLREGDNELLLACDYNENHPGLETVYLLGGFGVRLDGTRGVLTDEPGSLRLGDWVRQGLPFYAGDVTYRTRVTLNRQKQDRIVVVVPHYEGVGVRVLVDGVPAGIVAWEPQELDITSLVGRPRFELAFQVLGHRRNSHGPLHNAQKHHPYVGPDAFLYWDRQWSDAYQLVPCGLMKPPEIHVRRACAPRA
jgi:hypothetical protein